MSFGGTNLYEKSVGVLYGQGTSVNETVTISDLHPATHYRFQVSAKTECGEGKKSKEAKANTSVDG
jgi:hypothetical protein